ncbi:MAG: hypothetical protein J5588_08330 [Bacteroidales bacterium]|nr:hypothetical protein [Bacteroidales bacterium]
MKGTICRICTMLFVGIFMLLSSYGQNTNRKYIRHDHYEDGWLSSDNDSIYVITYEDIKEYWQDYFFSIHYGTERFSQEEYDFNSKSFKRIKNKEVTRILIIYPPYSKNTENFPKSTVPRDLFEKELPFNPSDFPNLKELLFVCGFPSVESLLQFKDLRSIYYSGYGNSFDEYHIVDDNNKEIEIPSERRGCAYFKVPERLAEMPNLVRLLIDEYYIEFPSNLHRFSNVKILALGYEITYSRYDYFDVLAMPSLTFLFCKSWEYRYYNSTEFFFQLYIKETGGGDVSTFLEAFTGNFRTEHGECPPYPKEKIRDHTKTFGDTTEYSIIFAQTESESQVLIQGTAIKHIPVGEWIVLGEKVNYSERKLGDIETDDYVFFYGNRNYSYLYQDGRLCAAYFDGDFMGEENKKTQLDELIKMYENDGFK